MGKDLRKRLIYISAVMSLLLIFNNFSTVEIFTRILNVKAEGINSNSTSHSTGMRPSRIDITKDIAKFPQIKSVALPSKYDLRELGRVTPVKNQGEIGDCWAFTTYGSIESNLLTNEKKVYDFSEINLASQHGFDWSPNDGGNREMAAAYLTRWQGPVSEEDDPYPNPAQPYNIEIRDGKVSRKHIQDILFIPDRIDSFDNDDIKNAVMKYGAVYSSIYIADGYYNSSKFSYYNNIVSVANHGVDIIGWDDSYSRYNFINTPPGDGAFICRNSWGSEWGDGGYFYMSYYDIVLGSSNAVYTGVEPVNNYSKIYQYDELGLVGYYPGPSTSLNEIWFTNIFTANTAGINSENLAAVSFYTTKENTSYEIFIESDNNTYGFSRISQSSVKLGTIEMPGYHTIKLDSSIKLTSGKKFAVAVKLIQNGVIAPLEMPAAGYSSKATFESGQSYLSLDGNSWSQLSNGNVCLKAFTNVTYAVPVQGVSLNNTQISLYPDETKTLSAAVSPTNASNKALIWESSNRDIVTVDEQGNVTALKPGTATITVTTVDGSYKSLSTVNVQAYPSISIPDYNLEKVIRTVLNKPAGGVTAEDMKKITSLYVNDENIRSLKGLEYAVNLRNADFSSNKISDLSPLAGLINLNELDCDNNRITDISPIRNLSNLSKISFDENKIRDISALANLRNLTDVSLRYNCISDVSPFANLSKLSALYLNDNIITDIEGIVQNINSGLLGRGTVYIYLNSNYLDMAANTKASADAQSLKDKGCYVTTNYEWEGAIIEDQNIESWTYGYQNDISFIMTFKNNIFQGSDFNNIEFIDRSTYDPIEIDVSISGNKLIINPKDNLRFNMDYKIYIPQNAIIDAENKGLDIDRESIYLTTQGITKADFNANNLIDIIDIATMARNYNKTERAVDWNLDYDPNDDGVVDIYDMIRISKLLGMH